MPLNIFLHYFKQLHIFHSMDVHIVTSPHTIHIQKESFPFSEKGKLGE